MKTETHTHLENHRDLYMSNPYRVGCHILIVKLNQITLIEKIEGDYITTLHGVYLKTELENIITASDRLATERWITV
jgi:hypothetical protein